MQDDKYIRNVQTAVNVFIYHKDEFLMIKRSPDKRIDPNKLNGVGGRLEAGENFLEAGVREVSEETGYEVRASDFRFCGIVRLEGGYTEDWIMCFFTCRVKDKNIPNGEKTKDGKFIWLYKEKVLNSNYEVVSDLKFLWNNITGKKLFFANAQINKNEEVDSIKISEMSV